MPSPSDDRSQQPSPKPSPSSSSDDEALGPADLDPSELLDAVEAWDDAEGFEPAAGTVGLDDLLPARHGDDAAELTGDAEATEADLTLTFDLTPREAPSSGEEGAHDPGSEVDIGFVPREDETTPLDDRAEGPDELLLLDEELPALDNDDDEAANVQDAHLALGRMTIVPLTMSRAEPSVTATLLAEGDWECMTLTDGQLWLAGNALALLTPRGPQLRATLPRRAGALAAVPSSSTTDATLLLAASRTGSLTCLHVRAEANQQGAAEVSTQETLDTSDYPLSGLPRVWTSNESLELFSRGLGCFRFDTRSRKLVPLPSHRHALDIAEGSDRYAVVQWEGRYLVRDETTGVFLDAPKSNRASELRLFASDTALFAYDVSGEFVAHAGAGSPVVHATLEEPLLAAVFGNQRWWLTVRGSTGPLRIIELALDAGRGTVILEDEQAFDPDDESQMCFDSATGRLYLLTGGRLLSLAVGSNSRS